MNKKEEMKALRKSNTGAVSYKSFNGVKADVVDSDRKIIEVKFASFGNIDSDGDMLLRGCFAKSIQERGPHSQTNRKIAFVWQHDIKEPIGKILELEEREDGAYAQVQLSDFDSVPLAKRAFSQMQDGTINQFSFGFSYIWDKMEYDENIDAFVVKELKLYEVSPVTLGANEMTENIGEMQGDDLKAALKSLSVKNKTRFDELKRYINTINEAEPVNPLTSGGLFDKIANSVND